MPAVPEAFFNPRSVAIVGASGDPSKLGYRPLENLRKVGFAGRIFLVNPRGGEIAGLPCYTSVSALPEAPDIAILLVPGAHAVEAARQCAELGVKAAIVASSGFAEAGEEGRRLQDRLRDAASGGLRILGPNTNGIYSAPNRFSLGYNSAHAERFEPGPVSVLSHSGAIFSVIAERMQADGVGLNKYVPVGNECDLDMLDFLEYLAGDEGTRVVLLLVEALRDGARFRSIVARLRRAGKRVAALKLGTSGAGSASTAAHSSRMAGNLRAYAALFQAAGVGCVTSIEALVAFARFATQAPAGWSPDRRRGVGIVTASGAGGTLLADGAARHGFAVADFGEPTREALRGFHASASSFNPMDVGNFGGTAHMSTTSPLVAADPNVDLVLTFAYTLQTATRRDDFANGVIAGAVRSAKPHAVLAPGRLPPEDVERLEKNAVPVFADSASMFEGLRAFYVSSSDVANEHAEPCDIELWPDRGKPPQGTLNEVDSMALLDRAGIPTVPRDVAATLDEALAAAEQLGWPIALKGVVDGIAHKSDRGLVELDVRGSDALGRAFRSVVGALASSGPRLCVQKMLRPELELLVGITNEAPLGSFLLAGWGGRHAESIDDVLLWPIPSSAADLRAGLAGTAVGRVLLGPRWGNDAGLDQLVDILMRLQAIAVAAGDALQAIEINPLGAGRDGLVALDALAVFREGA